jgi:hypothetical protein
VLCKSFLNFKYLQFPKWWELGPWSYDIVTRNDVWTKLLKYWHKGHETFHAGLNILDTYLNTGWIEANTQLTKNPFYTTVFIFYSQASDAYLQMAIGNAPWPIGVTMVGIHARTGREKIFSKNVAHVMNDETQRKYLQGLKRLMTKCQQYFPTDPSRCVEYTRTEL